MAKLQKFDGGKSTRLAPHLVGINTGVVYNNIDNESGELTPVSEEAATGVALDQFAFYFEAESIWVSTTVDTDYLEYREALYTSDGIGVPQRTFGGRTVNMGIVPPSAAPTVAVGGVGVLSGTYTYVYTYYDSLTGAESAPSPVSAEVAPSSQRVDLTAIVPSLDAQVDTIRIYRVGGVITLFSLVADIPAASVAYTDNIADVSIPGSDLLTEGYGQALAGARDIKEAYGIFWYTLGDNLYFSEVGKWWAWPPANFFDFDKPLTGYGFSSRGMLVYTKLRTRLITGTTKATFSKTNLSGSQGCRHYRSVQELGNGLVWVSEDGICASSGGKPVVVSRPVLGKINIQTTNSVVHDDVYYIQQIDGSILALDTRYGTVFKDFTLSTTRLIVALDVLYGYFTGTYKELFAGSSKHSFSYTSPEFLDGSYTERKNYKSVYIRHEGGVNVVILIDDAVVATLDLVGEGTYELDVDQSMREGYSIRAQITGKGTVKELEYKAIGNNRL